QAMTTRVVTLWCRAPELLHGAVEYGIGIDLWSAEYWKKIRLPSNLKHANQMAKPQFKRKLSAFVPNLPESIESLKV
ncbi:hypothetical protein Bca52824_095763, partial [Brassica carinata]